MSSVILTVLRLVLLPAINVVSDLLLTPAAATAADDEADELAVTDEPSTGDSTSCLDQVEDCVS